jgi:tripartite-type tricarboxylate transporter receptor subunit TctC
MKSLEQLQKGALPQGLLPHSRNLPGALKTLFGAHDSKVAAKSCWFLILLLSLLPAGCGSGASKDYPHKPITLICPWAAGGGTDRLSRFMADQLQRDLGQPVVVVNRTGGSGAVGHSAGANARPDGYTITMATFELSTMHWMGISPLTWEDFTPVAQLNADAAAIIVRKDSPFASVDEMLEFIRANPRKLTMSGTATGGAWDLARAGFLLAAGLPVNSVIWAPTQGAAPALVDLLGGHIDVVCCSVPEAASQIASGELVVLAVMSPERLEEFPEIPTVKELGVEWEAVGWRGLALPKGTSEEVVGALNEACQRIIMSEPYEDFMRKNGFAIQARGPAEFARFLEEQDAQWRPVIEAAGYARKKD